MTILETLQPLLKAARGLELTDPVAARTELEKRFDPDSKQGVALSKELKDLLAAGALCENGELPVRWGRVAKASEESLGFSIDVVHMNGAGPKHRHPAGEVNFCVPLTGKPQFEKQTRGWVVMAPDSTHVPEVQGGEMLIVYLLPRGEMEFIKG